MTMVLDIHTEIAELRAELAHCILTRKERADPRRVDRDLSRYAKDHSERAREELVAEIGSTLLCADLGIVPELEPRLDHAAYLGSWLTVLANGKRAIFSAAAHAQRAVTYLHGLQPQAETVQEAASCSAHQPSKGMAMRHPPSGSVCSASAPVYNPRP